MRQKADRQARKRGGLGARKEERIWQRAAHDGRLTDAATNVTSNSWRNIRYFGGINSHAPLRPGSTDFYPGFLGRPARPHRELGSRPLESRNCLNQARSNSLGVKPGMVDFASRRRVACSRGFAG